MTDALATVAEARELLGNERVAAAILDGSLRRVQYEGSTFVLGPDIDRLRNAHGRTWLARLFGLFSNPKTKGTSCL